MAVTASESTFEQATIEWLRQLGYRYQHGAELDRPLQSVGLVDDLRRYLQQRYRQLPAAAMSVAQKAMQRGALARPSFADDSQPHGLSPPFARAWPIRKPSGHVALHPFPGRIVCKISMAAPIRFPPGWYQCTIMCVRKNFSSSRPIVPYLLRSYCNTMPFLQTMCQTIAILAGVDDRDPVAQAVSQWRQAARLHPVW